MTPATLDRAALVRPFTEEYPFESRVLDLDGVGYHYLDEGPRGGPTLLFVHGNPSWSFLWRNAIRRQRARWRCIAPDHVGMGLSDKPGDYPYRLEQHAANLARLIDELQLERLVLVVHDWGGPIGLGALLPQVERLAGVAIANTAAFTGFTAPWRIRACRTPILGALAVRGFNAFARGAVHMAVERPLPARVRRGFLAPYRDWQSRAATLRFVEDIPLSPAHPSWPALAAIEGRLSLLRRMPAAILWGERDFCFTPAFREEWQRRLPDAGVTRFERAGHWLFEDACEEALDALAAFAERAWSTPPR